MLRMTPTFDMSGSQTAQLFGLCLDSGGFYALSTMACTSINCPAYPRLATPNKVAGGTCSVNESTTAFQAADRLACPPTG
jgi:hypothetical protein